MMCNYWLEFSIDSVSLMWNDPDMTDTLQLDLLSPVPSHPPVDMMAVRDLVVAGIPMRQIAARFGVKYDLVRKWASRHKWPTPNKILARQDELAAKNIQVIEPDTVRLDGGHAVNQHGIVVTGLSRGGQNGQKVSKGDSLLTASGDVSVTGEGQVGQVDTLTIIAEEARKAGVSALSGFVHRAAPVFNSFTPNVPETIGEASILMKMISKAAGLDNQASNNSTNVQVNIACGPWGRKVEDNSFQDADDIDG